MPYRRAWLFIVALIAATVFAFWRTYFSILPAAPLGFHIHGITASLWMLLLLAQSLTSHRGQMALHRTLGRATFLALPLFGAGAMAVMHSMAFATANGDIFYTLWGAPLGLIDALAFGAVLYAVAMALRHRRSVHLHAGYMLSTALMLFSPIVGRVINQTVPGFIVNGPQDFPLFGAGAKLSDALAAAVALWLWRRDPRHGQPWLMALGVIVVQIVGFKLVEGSDAARRVFATIGHVPLPAMMVLGFALGTAAVVLGWSAKTGRRRMPPA